MFCCGSVGFKCAQNCTQSILPSFCESRVCSSSSISREVSPSCILRIAARKLKRSSLPEPSVSSEQKMSSIFYGLALIICYTFKSIFPELILDGETELDLNVGTRKDFDSVVLEPLRVFVGVGVVFPVCYVAKISLNSANVRLSRPLLTEFQIPSISLSHHLFGRSVFKAFQNSSRLSFSPLPMAVK